jgi:D-serine deaminase-like pyridoxal phosphate-dependent protein
MIETPRLILWARGQHLMMEPRYAFREPSEVLSPSLLIYRKFVTENLQKMIKMARGAPHLRPHVKTHKMAEVVRLAESLGIRKHKCATITEAEMIAAAGGSDALLAYPLVGPNLKRFTHLLRGYRSTTFRATVDHPDAALALAEAASGLDRQIPVLVDLDIGMGRTGIDPGEPAASLYALIARLPQLAPDGLHAYDGHIHDSDPEVRKRSVQPGLEKTLALRDRLVRQGFPVPRIVMGGTPTFPIYADLELHDAEYSPGTIVLHDHNYRSTYPDLDFTPAALLLTRVVSRPRPGRLCLDLGHKAVAADPVGLRAKVLGIDDARPVLHSEEHLVIETSEADEIALGTPFLAIPAHVCPTVALHRRAYVIDHGQVVDQWDVTARDRMRGI